MEELKLTETSGSVPGQTQPGPTVTLSAGTLADIARKLLDHVSGSAMRNMFRGEMADFVVDSSGSKFIVIVVFLRVDSRIYSHSVSVEIERIDEQFQFILDAVLSAYVGLHLKLPNRDVDNLHTWNREFPTHLVASFDYPPAEEV